jgi:dihydrofolate reductase
MRKLIAITQLSVDDVMQGPGGPEEDPREGFNNGGWARPYVDGALSEILHETVAGEFDLLLGRRTYDIFAGYWPKQGGKVTDAFNKATKYVVTRAVDGLAWKESQRVGGDAVDGVRRLKSSPGPELHAVVREERAASRPHAGRNGEHAKRSSGQHVPAVRSASKRLTWHARLTIRVPAGLGLQLL